MKHTVLFRAYVILEAFLGLNMLALLATIFFVHGSIREADRRAEKANEASLAKLLEGKDDQARRDLIIAADQGRGHASKIVRTANLYPVLCGTLSLASFIVLGASLLFVRRSPGGFALRSQSFRCGKGLPMPLWLMNPQEYLFIGGSRDGQHLEVDPTETEVEVQVEPQRPFPDATSPVLVEVGVTVNEVYYRHTVNKDGAHEVFIHESLTPEEAEEKLDAVGASYSL